MSPVHYLVTLAILLVASAEASAFVVERAESGAAVHWPHSCVSWWIEASGCGDLSPTETSEAVRASFDTWDAVDTMYVDFEEAGVTCIDTAGLGALGAFNVAIWRDETDTWPYAERVVGLTTLTFDIETGELADADMEFNGLDFAFSTDGSPDTYDLQQAVTHEVGHLLGLGHSTVQESVMYATAGPGAIGKRTLAEDDIEGITANHGMAGAPPVEPCAQGVALGTFEAPHCPQPGGCGGGAGRSSLTVMLLALAAILLTRRRRRWRAMVLAATVGITSVAFSPPSLAQQCNPYIAANGEPIYWPVAQVELSLDPDLPEWITPTQMRSSTVAGLGAWADLECVEMAVTFRDEGDGFAECPGEIVEDEIHCIFWALPEDEWPYGSSLIAVTLVHHDPQTAEIVDTDVAINGTGTFSWSAPEICTPDAPEHDLLATLTHEFGHFFGLDHSGFAQSTMEGSTGPGDCGKRTLAAFDQACLCDTLATVPGPGEPDTLSSGDTSTGTDANGSDASVADLAPDNGTPKRGCDSSGTTETAPLQLLALLILWRRARRRRRPALRPALAR